MKPACARASRRRRMRRACCSGMARAWQSLSWVRGAARFTARAKRFSVPHLKWKRGTRRARGTASSPGFWRRFAWASRSRRPAAWGMRSGHSPSSNSAVPRGFRRWRRSKRGPRQPGFGCRTGLAEICLLLLRANSPDVLLSEVRQPHRPVADAYRIAAWAEPLFDHLVRCGIDFRKRDLKHRRPNMSGAERDLAAGARHAHGNVRDQFCGPGVDARYGPVALV